MWVGISVFLEWIKSVWGGGGGGLLVWIRGQRESEYHVLDKGERRDGIIHTKVTLV